MVSAYGPSMHKRCVYLALSSGLVVVPVLGERGGMSQPQLCLEVQEPHVCGVASV